jgi:hypothetical protein
MFQKYYLYMSKKISEVKNVQELAELLIPHITTYHPVMKIMSMEGSFTGCCERFKIPPGAPVYSLVVAVSKISSFFNQKKTASRFVEWINKTTNLEHKEAQTLPVYCDEERQDVFPLYIYPFGCGFLFLWICYEEETIELFERNIQRISVHQPKGAGYLATSEDWGMC